MRTVGTDPGHGFVQETAASLFCSNLATSDIYVFPKYQKSKYIVLLAAHYPCTHYPLPDTLPVPPHSPTPSPTHPRVSQYPYRFPRQTQLGPEARPLQSLGLSPLTRQPSQPGRDADRSSLPPLSGDDAKSLQRPHGGLPRLSHREPPGEDPRGSRDAFGVRVSGGELAGERRDQGRPQSLCE